MNKKQVTANGNTVFYTEEKKYKSEIGDSINSLASKQHQNEIDRMDRQSDDFYKTTLSFFVTPEV
jgi:hypothetical protein